MIILVAVLIIVFAVSTLALLRVASNADDIIENSKEGK